MDGMAGSLFLEVAKRSRREFVVFVFFVWGGSTRFQLCTVNAILLCRQNVLAFDTGVYVIHLQRILILGRIPMRSTTRVFTILPKPYA